MVKMNCINEEDEEEEEDNPNVTAVITAVDQFPSTQTPPECSSNSIYLSKHTSNTNDRSKYRPTSLPPARHSSSLNETIDEDIKQRRRYSSDSNTSINKNTPTTVLVTSFLQYLRNELKLTTNDKTNDYHQHTKQKLSKDAKLSRQSIKMNSKLSNENLLEINDHNEILTLIDLLVLRVECLTNEKKSKRKKKKKENHLTVAEVDQNLIEYLYYLFNKFTNDDLDSANDLAAPVIDKSNFVNVCQTLVRNGCFDISSTTGSISSDQSVSETTTSSNQTLTQQTFVHEYNSDIEVEKSSIDGQNPSQTSAEQDTWLVVDLQPTEPEDSIPMCLLPTSTSDEQLLIINDNYKSCESISSHSIYLSPNSSLFDIQNMVQELDESNNHSSTLLDEDGSSSNVIIESKTTLLSDLLNDDIATSNNICTRLTNDDGSVENSEQMTTNNTDRMSRREKKMHERWSTSTKDEKNINEQSSTKTLLGVDFPPIAVLRRKFSSANKKNKIETNSDSNPTTTIEEINTSPTTIAVDKLNPDQIGELPLKDVSALISTDVGKNNNDGQITVTVSEFTCLSTEEQTMRKKEDPFLPPIECQSETITNINNDLVDDQQSNNEDTSVVTTNPFDSNSLSSSSPPIILISPSPLTLTTNENKTVEPLPKEREVEKKEEEGGGEGEQRCDGDYNIDEKKKNNSSFVHDYHAPGIILINDEPTQTTLLQHEKKEKKEEEHEQEERERPSSLLPSQEQFNHQRTEDESSVQTLSKDLNQTAMANDNENAALYKKVEIEEIPDDEETILADNIDSIEPTDYIHTDEESKKPTQPSSTANITTTKDASIKFDNVLSCYEKALAKVVDTYDESGQPSNELAKESSITTQQSADDPIALRALQRFEERMNAAAARTSKDETNLLATKGKSSWSGSLSAPRKSLENLFKPNEQPLRSTPVSVGEESSTVTSSSQSNSYIRSRKTFDDNDPSYGTKPNLINITSSTINDDQHQPEEQQEPSAIVESDDKRASDNKSSTIVDTTGQQPLGNDIIMISERDPRNETESCNAIVPMPIDSSLNTITSQSSSTEQSAITPYRFQLEGRRRLNTHERMRERNQSREGLDTIEQQQTQLQNDYTLKPEETQDPIIRRALERFDEKSRTLTQTKSLNYDEIQDPITRRALMRLESNIKRTTPATTNDSNENWYTEKYTLGSLQPTNDRVSRYNDSSQSPTLNNKNKYISVHQRYCAPSSNDVSDNRIATNEQNIPVMRVPAQPIYLTSNNQEQQPLSLRQRSRSEDMLSSRDLVVGQTTNLDEIDTSSQLQRNRSSNQIALTESGYLVPNTLIKSLEPNFTRTTESTVSYTTPTQTYSAYSCEYTRPRRNNTATSSNTSAAISQESNQLPPPKYSQQQQQTEIQRPTPYRPTIENQYQSQSSSAFAPIRSSATSTTTSNYYGQHPLPTPSYGSTYTSSNLTQTPYSDDPIVRRALERFNSQMQGSRLSTSQYQPTNNYISHQGSLHDSMISSARPSLMTTSTSSNSSSGGYQSIIGRRRQTRHDDPSNFFIDNASVGDGYSSSLFGNSQNPYPMTNHYMNMSDEPPAIPPRFRRENYQTEDINDAYRRHSTDEYLSENFNNNNNNNSSQTLPRDAFIHHAYPATIINSNGFRPINMHYNQQFDSYNQLSTEQDDLRDGAQSTSSTNSSDSLKQLQQRSVRSNNTRTQINNQQRLPPSSISLRSNTQQNGRKINEQLISNKLSPEDPQSPSDQSIPNNGSTTGDSVFHRLAYTGTKASLSKSSSNSCSNLLNKNSPQIPTTQLKSCEIDFDDSSTIPANDAINTNEQSSTSTNKYQRSKSVDGRARLKIAQARANNNNNHTSIDHDEHNIFINDEQQRTIPSSKFTPVNGRRDAPPPRVPLTPTSTPRSTLMKRPSGGNNLSYTKTSNGFRTQGSIGNLLDTDNHQQEIENDENMLFNDDNYQPKIADQKTRTTLPVHRYITNNNIQSSPSTSSVSSTISRTKPPMSTPTNLDRRDSNTSNSDLNRTSRRPEDNRLVSPSGQRRNIPVSVFAPAKLDNKRPAPAPPTLSYESQQQTAYSSRLSTHDSSYPTKSNESETNTRTPSTNSGVKTPTRNIMNEYSLTTDKHDNNKKMNVFERLFRGNKKKN